MAHQRVSLWEIETGTTLRSPTCHPHFLFLPSGMRTWPSAQEMQKCSFSLSLVSTQKTLSSLGVSPTFQSLLRCFPPVAFPYAPLLTLAWDDEALTFQGPRWYSVLMDGTFCLSLQPLSTAGVPSSSSTTSNRSRNRSRYRTKAVSCEVDESLFGGNKVTLTQLLQVAAFCRQ